MYVMQSTPARGCGRARVQVRGACVWAAVAHAAKRAQQEQGSSP